MKSLKATVIALPLIFGAQSAMAQEDAAATPAAPAVTVTDESHQTIAHLEKSCAGLSINSKDQIIDDSFGPCLDAVVEEEQKYIETVIPYFMANGDAYKSDAKWAGQFAPDIIHRCGPIPARIMTDHIEDAFSVMTMNVMVCLNAIEYAEYKKPSYVTVPDDDVRHKAIHIANDFVLSVNSPDAVDHLKQIYSTVPAGFPLPNLSPKYKPGMKLKK